ncbi:TPR domain-containing protein [Verticillium dahliae]
MRPIRAETVMKTTPRREAKALLGRHHQDTQETNHAGSLNNLGNKLARRYDRIGATVDLEEAISVARQVVAVTPNGDPNQTTYLNSLANRLQSQYERTDTLADLEEAVSVARQVVQQLIGGKPLAVVGGITEESLTAKDDWHGSEVVMEREVAEATATRNMDLHSLFSRDSLGDTLRSLVDFWGLNDLLYDMIDIFMPPVKTGYRRLRWRCFCGAPLWGDFDNTDPEAWHELLERLHHVPGIVKITGNTRQLSLQESYASRVSGQRGRTMGIQARNPGTYGMENQGIRSVRSSSVIRGLGTTVMKQGTRSSPLYDNGQPVLRTEIGNPTSVAPDPTT